MYRKADGMTKQEQIRRQAARVQYMAYPVALVAIAFIVYCQLTLVSPPREFWVCICLALGCGSVLFLWLFWHRIRCPDCQKSVAFSCREKNPLNCPHCGTDCIAEMR